MRLRSNSKETNQNLCCLEYIYPSLSPKKLMKLEVIDFRVIILVCLFSLLHHFQSLLLRNQHYNKIILINGGPAKGMFPYRIHNVKILVNL